MSNWVFELKALPHNSAARAFCRLLRALVTLAIIVVVSPTISSERHSLLSLGSFSFVSHAVAQDADDDDDDDDGGGGGGGGGGAPGAVGEIDDTFDDGDSVGPRDSDDCFEEVYLRPSWLRPCKREPAAKPIPAGAGSSLRTVPRSSRGGSSGSSAGAVNFGGQLGPVVTTVDREPPNALAREIVAVRISVTQLAALEARGFVVLSRSPGPLAIGDLFRFGVPGDLSTADARALAQQLAPSAIIDFNHIYRPAQQAQCDMPFCRQRRAILWPQPPNECMAEASLGVVDTAIDINHPALAGQKIELAEGVSGGRPQSSKSHGTAIAGLLIGRSDAAVPGLLPRGSVYAVQAFHKGGTGEDIGDTFDIVSAIDTIARRNIDVINLSFVGPNNKVLAEMVRRAVEDGRILIAAAGNQGPTAPVVYPAGYERVVAVTAVGDDLRIYRGANRGNYIDFSAPGVNVEVVSAKVASRFETGTSFAAPFIAAALAAARSKEPAKSAADLVAMLQTTATDLGRPGRDPIFGWGLVQVPDVCK